MGEPELSCGSQQLNPIDDRQIQISQISPAALAYLGDAVYELYVRSQYLFPPKRSQVYHQQVVERVRAETQSNYLQLLLSHLTPAELDIVRRGRNSARGTPRRLSPEVYQQATGLEALVGYLHLTDPARLQTLLALLPWDSLPSSEQLLPPN
jgi:ribonuclease III family protein